MPYPGACGANQMCGATRVVRSFSCPPARPDQPDGGTFCKLLPQDSPVKLLVLLTGRTSQTAAPFSSYSWHPAAMPRRRGRAWHER